MKIALVHSFYSSAVPSGENTVVQMQAETLRNAGHEVELIDVHTDELARNRLYKLTTALNVATGHGDDPSDRIRRFGPDVVHVHNLFPNFSTKWIENCSVPIVATVHNFRPVCSAGTLFRSGKPCTKCPDQGQHHSVINACYKDSRIATLPLAIRNLGGIKNDPVLMGADKLIFLSERSLATYVELGLSPDNCTIVPNFVDVRDQSPSKSGPWLYAGRLTEEKGILDLLEHWPTDTALKVLGDGPCMDAAKRLAGPNVSFSGSVPREVVLDEMLQARGLVLPSQWAEGLPTIYLEALAAGLPVVTRDGNSAADDILRHGHGQTYSAPEELSRAIDAVNHRWEEFAERSGEHYLKTYTPSVWLARIVETYRCAMDRRKVNQ